MISRRALLVAIAVVAAGCGSSATAPLKTVSARGFPLGDLTVQRGDRTLLRLTVEIADTAARQAKGLMGVKDLAADQGMAFVFPQPVTDGFWMKDTLIPLDIAFWDAQGHVVDVQHMVPCTANPCPITYAAHSYSDAVETRTGALAAAGVRTGDDVVLAWRATAVATVH